MKNFCVYCGRDGIPILIFYPNYKKHNHYAPFERNIHIANASTHIIACVINPQDSIQDILQRKVAPKIH